VAIRLTEPRLYLGRDLSGIESFRLANGTACVFTVRAPGKQTDNEDSVGLIPCGDRSCVLTVADGLGGLPGGEQASSTAVQELSQLVRSHCSEQLPLRQAILEGIDRANSRILERATGSATTLAVVEIEDHAVRPYHVGDSAILLSGQRGKIKHLTITHSPVGYAVEAGLVEADEAIYHEERHLVSNVIGTTEMRVEMGPRIQLAPRDTLVIASDGLFDNLQIEEIVDLVRIGPLAEAAATLAELCHTRMTEVSQMSPHKPDDLGFILFRPV